MKTITLAISLLFVAPVLRGEEDPNEILASYMLERIPGGEKLIRFQGEFQWFKSLGNEKLSPHPHPDSLGCGKRFEINQRQVSSSGVSWLWFAEGDVLDRFIFRHVPALPDIGEINNIATAKDAVLLLGTCSVPDPRFKSWDFVRYTKSTGYQMMVIEMEFGEDGKVTKKEVALGKLTGFSGHPRPLPPDWDKATSEPGKGKETSARGEKAPANADAGQASPSSDATDDPFADDGKAKTKGDPFAPDR